MFKRRRSGNAGMEIEDYVLTATEREAAKMERPLGQKGLEMLWWIALIAAFLLSLRATYLAVVKGPYYAQVAKGNSVRSVVIKAPRGRIFDRFGTPLVSNIPSIDAVIVPSDLPEDGQLRNTIAKEAANVLGMNEEDVMVRMENTDRKSSAAVLLKENITHSEALVLMEKEAQLGGVSIEKTAIREYADSVIFAHVLGYEGKIERKEYEENAAQGYLLTDYIGKQGIEKSYEKELRGVHGARQLEVDSRGNAKRELGIINPTPGSDLFLGIDAQLQKKLYDSLTSKLEGAQTRTGAAVAIDPRNGEVLALVNVPSFDNNLFAKKIPSEQYAALIADKDKPLFNRAVAGEYAPGSTIKPAIAAGALAEGIITPETIIDGLGGTLRIGSFSFGDWKVHGPSDVRTAIAESNDIFFYTIGGGYGSIGGMGMTRMKKYYELFGFGRPTGVDMGGEASGFIPNEQWKLDKLGEKWYIGNSYHASIGQGYVTSTPLQLANYTAALANGGTLWRPHIVSKIKNQNGEESSVKSEKIRSGIMDKHIMQVVLEGMRKTITDGTAQQLKDLPVAVAGKTGTAQFGNENRTHSWFVSFAPYENPEIAMVVLVEGAGEGQSGAVPVTKEVYEWYFGGRN